MSNRLHQLNAGYDALQDRILFSIGAEDGTEFRFWITRRYLLLLWSMLVKLATAFAGVRASGDPIRREALAELAHRWVTLLRRPASTSRTRPLSR